MPKKDLITYVKLGEELGAVYETKNGAIFLAPNGDTIACKCPSMLIKEARYRYKPQNRIQYTNHAPEGAQR